MGKIKGGGGLTEVSPEECLKRQLGEPSNKLRRTRPAYKVRFIFEFCEKGRCASYVCFETMLPFIPVAGQLIWGLPGTVDWSDPFVCCAPVYLYQEDVLVVAEEDEGFVANDVLAGLRAAGWFECDAPYGVSG